MFFALLATTKTTVVAAATIVAVARMPMTMQHLTFQVVQHHAEEHICLSAEPCCCAGAQTLAAGQEM